MRSPVCSDLCCFLFRNDQTINDGWKAPAGLWFMLDTVNMVGYPAALLVFWSSVSVPLWHINWDEATFALHALWWWDSSHTKAEAFRMSPHPWAFLYIYIYIFHGATEGSQNAFIWEFEHDLLEVFGFNADVLPNEFRFFELSVVYDFMLSFFQVLSLENHLYFVFSANKYDIWPFRCSLVNL